LGVMVERPLIYHGTFGSGFFQRLYAPNPSYALMFTTSLEYHVMVNGPLLVLAIVLPALWPLPLASFGISLVTCLVAAGQADLPKTKQRYWSRPLIASLFLLQPICRGLARYRTQLRFRPASGTPPPHPTSARVRLVQDPSEVLSYWSDGSNDRYTLLSALLERLRLEQWRVESDVGWTDHDLDLVAGACCRLRLTTVIEQLDRGRMNLRCRLEARWSLAAKIFYWSIFGLELVVAKSLASWFPWIWLVLLSLPVLHVLLDHAGSQQRKLLGIIIDEVARGLNLQPLPSTAEQHS
jgi:O-antigen biosynthesis protein